MVAETRLVVFIVVWEEVKFDFHFEGRASILASKLSVEKEQRINNDSDLAWTEMLVEVTVFKFEIKNESLRLSAMVYTCPVAWEAEAGPSQASGHPGLHSETLSQKHKQD